MSTTGAPTREGLDHTGWKPHLMRQRDGHGRWILREAEIQFLQMPTDLPLGAHHPGFVRFCPFGVTQMDNGEIIIVGISDLSAKAEKTVVIFNAVGGETWTPPRRIGRVSTPLAPRRLRRTVTPGLTGVSTTATPGIPGPSVLRWSNA